ncbi:sulfite oxidase, mitochondrial [Drosophila subpulchrella]|uniref:sulfite oxidase, mitochondrial n=1 Tax=Drosophila subpulchrella TaxID=1486046 RepID=UPI0018A176A8|nr:sulfite oxidase, mitochondrial [Drosophila subpulchrella]XP_037726720.1 sulfite oxidase, mitochondrial [Drosophila subpulchrella]
MRWLRRSWAGLLYQRHQQHHRRFLLTTNRESDGEREQQQHYKWSSPGSRAEQVLYAGFWAGGLTLGFYWLTNRNHNVLLEEQVSDEEEQEALARLWHMTLREELPTYKNDVVEQHNCPEKGIWVTYGLGVYDVTDFVENHPGGDKILMAAGSAIDPFWAIYQQHNTLEVLELLEGFRIGNLEGELVPSVDDELGSPWSQEPQRHALLKPASKRPFNAEPPIGLLAEQFYTPNDLFYVRNHLPVPVISPEDYELEIEGGEKKKTLSLEGIKDLPKYSVTAAIMCGGNRRSEMTKVKAVKGLSWGAGAVGNAKWSGARLCDVLKQLGVQPDETKHVIFEGADLDPTSHPYGASIPLAKALDPRGDVILAYEMNDEPLSRDHGYPIRVIVPGTVGARNVKWLTRIVVADRESDSHWQQNDYKGFSPSTDWDTVDFSKSDAIQAMPVTSAICTPQPGSRVKIDDDEGHIAVRGYAWSGGGRKIVRVDLSNDEGLSWHVAELEQEDIPDGRHYGWSLWTARLPVSEAQRKAGDVEIWAKAVDSAYNVQPEKFEHIWNLRGVLANAYHKVKVKIV